MMYFEFMIKIGRFIMVKQNIEEKYNGKCMSENGNIISAKHIFDLNLGTSRQI